VSHCGKQEGMLIDKAEEYTVRTDEKRNKLIVDFLDKKPQCLDYLFDATLNRSTYSIGQLSSLIMTLYETKLGIKLQV